MDEDSKEMTDKVNSMGDKHIGFHSHRLNSDNPREVAFSETWKKENEERRYINRGHGILQDLFIDDNGVFHHTMIPRDKMIAATVVQWLGSNCGMAFIETALKECGIKFFHFRD